jgi:hypothetical protein
MNGWDVATAVGLVLVYALIAAHIVVRLRMERPQPAEWEPEHGPGLPDDRHAPRPFDATSVVIREFHFDDPIACSGVTLVVNGPQPSFSDGTVGVLHDGCDWLADVTPDLDAFYCQACQRNGRISGAWAVDCVRSVRAALAREWRKTGRT